MEILYCFDLESGLVQQNDDAESNTLILLDRPFYDFIIISNDNKALIVWNGFDKLS